jgi:ankyrin repeat protein
MNYDTWSECASFCNAIDYGHISQVDKEINLIYKKFNRLEAPKFESEDGLYCTDSTNHLQKYITLPVVTYLHEYKQCNETNILILACKFGNMDVIKYLISIDVVTSYKCLSVCIFNQHGGIAKYLLSLNDDVITSVQSINNGFKQALLNNDTTLISKLLACEQEYLYSGLTYTLKRDNHEAFKLILENSSVRVNVLGNNGLLVRICQQNKHQYLELLLKNGIDASYNNDYALQMACENDSYECVELLIHSPYVNPNVNNDWCFLRACRQGYHRIVKLYLEEKLVEIKFDIDKENTITRGLQLAKQYNKGRIFKIIAKSFDKNSRNAMRKYKMGYSDFRLTCLYLTIIMVWFAIMGIGGTLITTRNVYGYIFGGIMMFNGFSFFCIVEVSIIGSLIYGCYKDRRSDTYDGVV